MSRLLIVWRLTQTATQKITFTSTPPSVAHVNDTYTVTATGGGSPNPVTFSSLSASTCTVAGNAVTFIGAGDCVVAADQAAADGYFAAPQATQTIAVTLRAQTIVFNPALPARDTLGATLPLGATGGTSGNAVTFTILTPATCAVVSGKLSLTAIGACTVAADHAGNGADAAAPRVTATISSQGEPRQGGSDRRSAIFVRRRSGHECALERTGRAPVLVRRSAASGGRGISTSRRRRSPTTRNAVATHTDGRRVRRARSPACNSP